MRALILTVLFVLVAPRGATAQQSTVLEHDAQARAYFRTGAYVLAAEQFLKAYEIDKKPGRLFNAALAYEKANEIRKASEFFGKYLSVAPAGDKVTEARARKASLDQAIAEAEREAKDVEAVKARDRKVKEQLELARAHQKAGRQSEAASAYEAAYEAGKNAEFLFEKAEALRLSGQKDQAKASYRRYLQEAPEGVSREEARWRLQEAAPNSSTFATTGSVLVRSKYVGEIALDGKKTGRRTPQTLEGLRPGEHSVRVYAEGRMGLASVTIHAGETATVLVPFPDPQKGGVGGLLIEAPNAQGAIVYLDGKRLGKVPQLLKQVSSGRHNLRIDHPEFAS